MTTNMTSPTSPVPHLHAELLPNIRQITLHVSLPLTSSTDQKTPTPIPSPSPITCPYSLSLSDSRRTVTLSGPGGTQTLNLPGRISESAHATLAQQPIPTKLDERNNILLFRFPVDNGGETARALNGGGQHDVQVPWTAKDMCAETRVRCRQCKNVLFGPGEQREIVWKDLPSADWAEMMDLWHCHKPDAHADDHENNANSPESHIHDENELVKGYGAANQVECEPGTVLVDVLSFVLADEDSQGLKKSVCRLDVNIFILRIDSKNVSLTRRPQQDLSSSSPNAGKVDNGGQQNSAPNAQPAARISCSGCGNPVGEEHTSLHGLRLYKTDVSVLRKPKEGADPDDDLWETYPVDMVVGAHLLELVERIGARRFVVHSAEYRSADSERRNSGMLLWVFNPDMRYSSSSSTRSPGDGDGAVTAQRAMKVFYQAVPDTQAMLNPERGLPSLAALEELSLPESIYDSMKLALERSNTMLPGPARRFAEWQRHEWYCSHACHGKTIRPVRYNGTEGFGRFETAFEIMSSSSLPFRHGSGALLSGFADECLPPFFLLIPLAIITPCPISSCPPLLSSPNRNLCAGVHALFLDSRPSSPLDTSASDLISSSSAIIIIKLEPL
ncbi:hypothetical protein FQN55_004360 [Onygenales sp. PD_40]|nr:hypothetical protein FQN55_004360 [Onygenales sp. PD_40]